MGYPEEESDNKKVETKDIFLDEYAKKSGKVNKTNNDDLHTEDLKTNGCYSDDDKKDKLSDSLSSEAGLCGVIANTAFDKIDNDVKSCLPLSKTNPVNSEECLNSSSKDNQSHGNEDKINYDMSSKKLTIVDRINSNTKDLIGSGLIYPSCDSKNSSITKAPLEGKNLPCTNLTSGYSKSKFSNICCESESIKPSTSLNASIANFDETAEDNDEDSSWQCFKISNVVSLKKSENDNHSEVEATSNQNLSRILENADKQAEVSAHSSIVTEIKKSTGTYADAFINFVSKGITRTINNLSNVEKNDPNPENEKIIKFAFKNCKRKVCKKKLFSSKEIAMMKGYPSRCNSISLFNGRFLTRRNFSTDHMKTGKLMLPEKKLKFIRNINNNTSLKRMKKGKRRLRKVLGLVGERAKPKQKVKSLSVSISENSSVKNRPSCVFENSIEKKVVHSRKNFKASNAMQKKATCNSLNSSIGKDIVIIGNDMDSISSVDDLSSSFMDVKDSEKLYSQLIEEAIVTDSDSSSEKSFRPIPADNERSNLQNLGNDADSASVADVANTTLPSSSESYPHLFSSKSVLPRQMSARRKSPSRSKSINDIEVKDQCCGHWFPTRKSYINHLIKMEADSIHMAKLLDNEMVKCHFCPIWTTANGEKKHLKENHGIKCPTSKSSTASVPLTAKASSKCIGGKSKSNSRVMKNAFGNEPGCDNLENSESRPCPMSKKLMTTIDTSKKIICNLTDDPMASDSVIKIASVSELPNHLKPVIQLSLKENIAKQSSYNSSLLNDITCTLSIPLKPLSGFLNNSLNYTSSNLENSKHRKFSKNNTSENILSPISNGSVHNGNNKFAFSTKDENFLNISKGSRFNSENNGSLKKRMRRRRRSSRLSLDCSPERIARNDSLSKIKFRSSKLKRNRTLRRNGRKVRRCGFHSSETSDGTTSQSESEASENHESEFLDYDDDNNNFENIPTVELDLFTIDSFNEEPSVFLTDPTNPNFKVFASMDAIFVGDSALGDVTNQVGYITDINNVVYVNPSHFLFPKIEDNEFSNKRGNSKITRNIVTQSRPLRKAIITFKEDLYNAKDAKSNSRTIKLSEDILAIATESIKGDDKENLSAIDNNVFSKSKVASLQLEEIRGKTVSSNLAKDNTCIEGSSKLSPCSEGDLQNSFQIKPQLQVSTPVINNSSNRSVGLSTFVTAQSKELSMPKHPKSTIVVGNDDSKRKIVLKNTINEVSLPNQNVIVIKTSTNKVNGGHGIPKFTEQNIQKLSAVTAGKKSVLSIDKVHVFNELKRTPSSYCDKQDGNFSDKILTPTNLKQNFSSNMKCITEGDDIAPKNTSIDKVDSVFGLKNAAFESSMKNIPKRTKTDIAITDNEVVDIFDGGLCLNDSFSSYMENNTACSSMGLDEVSLDKTLASIDELIYTKESANTSYIKVGKEFDLRTDYQKKNYFSPVKAVSNNSNGMKKVTDINHYQKDDIISLDDAIAALAPCESDKIEECLLSNRKHEIDRPTVDIADLDAVGISSFEPNSDFSSGNPKENSVPASLSKTTSNEFKWSTSFTNSVVSQPHLYNNNFEYESKKQNFTPSRPLANQSLPQIEVVGDSQVVVASAEITPFETLEGGVCLEDVLENDSEDFDILSMNGFVIKKQNTVTENQSAPNLELCSVSKHDINSIPSSSTELNMQTLDSTNVDCLSEKEFTKENNISTLTESFLNSTFEDLETSQEPTSPSKYSNIFSIADIVKGKNLWDTPLLCSPIKPCLDYIPTTPYSPSRTKLNQLLDVPLSSIPDLLSPSRELAEGFLENGPVELSPNTVSSILSPNVYRKNSNLLSPIVDSIGIEHMAEASSNLNKTPNKMLKMKKKSAKKNMRFSPKSLEFDKGIHLKEESRFGLNQNSKNFSSTPKNESRPNLYTSHSNANDDLTNELTIAKLSPKKTISKSSSKISSSSSKSPPLKNDDLCSTELAISKSFTSKSASFQSSSPSSPNHRPPKIGFLVNNSPLYKSSEKESTNYSLHNSSCSDASMDMSTALLPGDSPSNSSHQKFPGFLPSDPSPSKVSLETFSGLLSRSLPSNASNSSLDNSLNERNSLKFSPVKKLTEIKPSFEGFISSCSTELSDHGNASLRMKISLKGLNHSKSEASFNNISDSFLTDDDDRNKTNLKNKSPSSSSCSDSSGSSSSSNNSDSSSSSSSDSEDSSDENSEEDRKIVLTQFDSVSGRRKKSPKKPVRASSPVSSSPNDVNKMNVSNNIDLTSLKITVRESEKCLENTSMETCTDWSSNKLNDKSPIIASNKQNKLINFQANDETGYYHSDLSVSREIAGHNVTKDRIWHSRDAKLKAQVMISDHQKGISDTSVGSMHFNELDSPNNTLSKISKKIDSSDMVSLIDANKIENLSILQGKKSENRDIRSYFAQPPVVSHKNTLTPESREASLHSPFTFVSRTMKSIKKKAVSHKKTNKRKRSEENIDIRNFLSPQELKAPVSVEVNSNPSKKICTDDSLPKLPNRSTKKNIGKLCASDIQRKYEEIVQNSVNNSDDILTPQDLNFKGFDKPSRISSIRSRILLEYSDVLKMTWWFVTDRYPLPVDQLCDWDEDQLNSILFENG